jgi:2-polyprenyl-3-methyl-5-hydroxy-6-metoxy-1,4-benzoquinol methylase
MTESPLRCIICGNLSLLKMLNSLSMRCCSSCGFVWREHFDVSAEDYTKRDITLDDAKLVARRQNIEDRISTICRYAPLDNLCDIGCGEGTFIQMLQERGAKNVIGIEPAENVAAYARQVGIPIISGTATDAPRITSEHNLRAVSLFHVIEHLEYPRATLESLHAALPVGGFIILETPNLAGHSMRQSGFQHPLICAEHLFYFNESNLRQLLQRTGFSVVAEGKRDFNQRHMPLRESVSRLGISRNRDKLSLGVTPGDGGTSLPAEDIVAKSYPREMIRSILSRLVIAMGRLDYIWIVGVKQ